MKLHTWLEANGKTAAWLAGETGLHRSYVTRLIERNGVADRSPSMETCVKIAKATQGAVTAIDFIPETKPEPKRKRAA